MGESVSVCPHHMCRTDICIRDTHFCDAQDKEKCRCADVGLVALAVDQRGCTKRKKAFEALLCVCSSVCFFLCLIACLLVCLSIGLLVCFSLRLFVCLSVFMHQTRRWGDASAPMDGLVQKRHTYPNRPVSAHEHQQHPLPECPAASCGLGLSAAELSAPTRRSHWCKPNHRPAVDRQGLSRPQGRAPEATVEVEGLAGCREQPLPPQSICTCSEGMVWCLGDWSMQPSLVAKERLRTWHIHDSLCCTSCLFDCRATRNKKSNRGHGVGVEELGVGLVQQTAATNLKNAVLVHARVLSLLKYRRLI